MCISRGIPPTLGTSSELPMTWTSRLVPASSSRHSVADHIITRFLPVGMTIEEWERGKDGDWAKSSWDELAPGRHLSAPSLRDRETYCPMNELRAVVHLLRAYTRRPAHPNSEKRPDGHRIAHRDLARQTS
ncbi:hypothetical protein NUW54_g6276 [Trametes sanguinea]|uniref:Uncharacterized protein n=1 Tax=Trametes sanguinea TaxID=158606 RepID=A0ACC1PTR0_9APHY|nr:hypothetical protein NUW54_g6276 [Trametes sanguinea]